MKVCETLAQGGRKDNGRLVLQEGSCPKGGSAHLRPPKAVQSSEPFTAAGMLNLGF